MCHQRWYFFCYLDLVSTLISAYHPILNEFKKRILKYVNNGTNISIWYETVDWERVKVVGRLSRVFVKDGAEFLETDNGLVIRLDYLISVDLDIKPFDRCGIDAAANPCGDASEY